jgi:hypothetical protein
VKEIDGNSYARTGQRTGWGTVTFKFYRSATHPDMLFEIRMKLEDLNIDIRHTELVAGFMDYYGLSIEKAIYTLISFMRAGEGLTNL